MRRRRSLWLGLSAAALVLSLIVGCSAPTAQAPASPTKPSQAAASQPAATTAPTAAAPTSAPAAAQSKPFPTKGITIVVTSGPGSGQDLTARQLAEPLSKIAGQPITVVNKAGGAAAVGYGYALEQPHDGHTLLITCLTHTLYPYTSGSDYDYRKFRGLAKIAADWEYLVVSASSPWKTLEDFLAAAKKGSPTMKFSGPSVGSVAHVTAHRFAKEASFEYGWVPSATGGEALVGVLGNQIPAIFAEPVESWGHYESNKIRYLAVAAAAREKALPEIPTFKEKGYNLVSDNWRGIVVAADTPPDIVKKLEEMVKKAIEDPSFVAQVEKSRSSITYMNGEEFTKETERLNEQAKQIAADLGLQKTK